MIKIIGDIVYIVSFQNCRTKGKDLQERKDQVEQPHEEGREFIT